MWPSLGPDAIVFENAGYLYTFDLQTQAAEEADDLQYRASAIRP